MKHIGSFNKNIMRFFLIASIVFGFLIISLFYTVEMYHIRQGGIDAIRQKFIRIEITNAGHLPEIYFLSLEDDIESYLSGLELDLYRYYQKNLQRLPLEQVYHFAGDGTSVYFYPTLVKSLDLSQDVPIMVYADMSFPTKMVKNATLILSVVSATICLFLYYLERRIVQMLDEKDRNMKQFFSNASHELKTPLMAIRGYAEGLEDGITDQKKSCAIIKKETDIMTGLVNSILEISKLDGGMVEPHLDINDVREILYDAIQVIEPTAQKKGVRIDIDLPEPILLSCDEEMLFSVYSNILTNSIRYAQKHIFVSSSFHKERASLTVRVENDGMPISDEDKTHIFERFYKGAGGQSGIGMALSLEYMKLLHGTITVSTEAGHTVFKVILGKKD